MIDLRPNSFATPDQTDERPAPAGYATVAPWIVTRDTARQIEHAEAQTELRDFAWGDRGGGIRDPLGTSGG